MASRNIRCECGSCGAVWRMARTWIDAAKGGLSCPSCHVRGVRVGDGVSAAERVVVEAAVASSLADLDAGLAEHLERQRWRRARLRENAAKNKARLNGGSHA